MNNERAIVTVSLGDRPFFPDTLPSMRVYAERTGAELLVRQYPEITPSQRLWLADVPWAGIVESARLLKFYYVREALREYRQVLLLDDSCYISRGCPDIFMSCRGPELAGVVDRGLAGSTNLPGKVVNTGVLVYGQQQRPFLDGIKSRLAACSGKLADQDVLNGALQEGSLDIQWLDWRFNVVGSQLVRRKQLDDKPWIYHLTSRLRPRRRIAMARNLRIENA